MHYTFVTPPASRAADRPTPVDDILVADTRRALADAIASVPFAASLSRSACQALLVNTIATLTMERRREKVPVEKLIVAIKLAWGSLPGVRLRVGDAAPEALTAMVTACIETYFPNEARGRAD